IHVSSTYLFTTRTIVGLGTPVPELMQRFNCELLVTTGNLKPPLTVPKAVYVNSYTMKGLLNSDG
ncbi:MAG: hypothetical protein WCK53_08130, partial [Methanomicrobiales archaeon]